jgi:phosphatidate phosphatase APP1
MSRLPHRAARLEDRLHRILEGTLDGRGWRPRVVPFAGYGTPEWVRVLARVALSPDGGDHPRPADVVAGAPADVRGWRRFVTASAPATPVRVTVGATVHVIESDREGYVDVRLPASLDPGWHQISLEVEGRPAATAPVRVVGPTTTLGVVSDIDDTVIVTMLPQPLVAFRNAFLMLESARTPVAGMADLYAGLAAGQPDVFVVYLSTGAWNTAGALSRFLHHHGFPRGPLLLTDWGPTATSWFRSGRGHKRAQLRRLLEDLPDLSWVLVGDDGQHDPEIYAELAAEHPDRVTAIAIRELNLAEQVVGHGNPLPRDSSGSAVEVRAHDGFGLAAALRERGLVL